MSESSSSKECRTWLCIRISVNEYEKDDFCFVVLLGLASCSDQLTISKNEIIIQPEHQAADEYHYYLEKARWGDAGAYVKLADFYREGKYVCGPLFSMIVDGLLLN